MNSNCIAAKESGPNRSQTFFNISKRHLKQLASVNFSAQMILQRTPVDLSWKPLLVLAAFTVALIGLAAWKLESMHRSAHRIEGRSAAQPLVEVPS